MCGMDASIIKKHWLNRRRPRSCGERKTIRRRPRAVYSREKGIGRFAIFKLGKKVRVITRRQATNIEGRLLEDGEQDEFIIKYDFSNFTDDFNDETGSKDETFLDELSVELIRRPAERIVKKSISLGTLRTERPAHGTIIEISDLKSKWSEHRIGLLTQQVSKLQPIFQVIHDSSDFKLPSFSIWIYKDKNLLPGPDENIPLLLKCLTEKSVFRITEGTFDAVKNEFSFKLNEREVRIGFSDSDITSLKLFSKYFGKANYKVECGSFHFEFYIFDLDADAESGSKYYLDKKDRSRVKEHRIYLYRDEIRVMPYGDTEDDWLQIDMMRGTIRTSHFLSNDQVVGCIYITQKENPQLKDKTNREGLVEEGKALDDFIHVIQVFLRYIRAKTYEKYLVDKKNKGILIASSVVCLKSSLNPQEKSTKKMLMFYIF